jgi:two-component system response regulator (stage 0 sporulation protein F)
LDTRMTDKKTVLVVDDEFLIRWALKEELKDRYHVLTAASVDEALDAVKSGKIDAVITDLRMPMCSGMELVKHVRGLRPEVKVFVISAVGSDDEFNRCYDLDVDAVLRKPLEMPLICRLLELHLEASP